jgi:hypothetical protein
MTDRRLIGRDDDAIYGDPFARLGSRPRPWLERRRAPEEALVRTVPWRQKVEASLGSSGGPDRQSDFQELGDETNRTMTAAVKNSPMAIAGDDGDNHGSSGHPPLEAAQRHPEDRIAADQNRSQGDDIE